MSNEYGIEMDKLTVFVWVTPAGGRYSPLDHTWVTSYDNTQQRLKNIKHVIRKRKEYWYCHGSFHASGGTPKYEDGKVCQREIFGQAARCLVGTNDKGTNGTIEFYGVHGVCHQVMNQVLYPGAPSQYDPLKDKGIRGYRASTAVYGRYGNQREKWRDKTRECSPWNIYSLPPMSLLQQRLMAALPVNALNNVIERLESLRINLLSSLNEIGYRTPEPGESPTERANELNDKINAFLLTVSETLRDSDQAFVKIFGLEPKEEIDLIDPKIFRFPD